MLKSSITEPHGDVFFLGLKQKMQLKFLKIVRLLLKKPQKGILFYYYFQSDTISVNRGGKISNFFFLQIYEKNDKQSVFDCHV